MITFISVLLYAMSCIFCLGAGVMIQKHTVSKEDADNTSVRANLVVAVALFVIATVLLVAK